MSVDRVTLTPAMLDELVRSCVFAGTACALGVASNVAERIGPTLTTDELAMLIAKLPPGEIAALAIRDADARRGGAAPEAFTVVVDRVVAATRSANQAPPTAAERWDRDACTCAACGSFRPGFPFTPEDPCLSCQERGSA